MITFRILSHKSSYNKKSSINSISNNRCNNRYSGGSFISSRYISISGYRLYSRCKGRSSSNKNKSKSERKRKRREGGAR